MRRLLFVVPFLVLLHAPPLDATVIVPLEFRELVAAAPVIVHGRVVDVRAGWVEGRRRVETIVTLQAAEYLKGRLGEEITFRVPGGQIGRYRTIMIGAPEFSPGDEVVLFLNAAGPDAYVYGLSLGLFRVVTDETSGRRVVIPPPVMAKLLGDAEVVIRGDRARQPLAVDAFKETVRQTIASQGGAR
jgi:hypothetical protein